MNAHLSPATEIQVTDLAFRWIEGFYDGILSGFATFRGELCYFEIYDDTTDDRKFTLHSLSAEEAQAASRDYEAFRTHHGDHNDLLPNGSRAGGKCRTTIEEAVAMGDSIAASTSVVYRLNPIVGWFTSAIL